MTSLRRTPRLPPLSAKAEAALAYIRAHPGCTGKEAKEAGVYFNSGILVTLCDRNLIGWSLSSERGSKHVAYYYRYWPWEVTK